MLKNKYDFDIFIYIVDFLSGRQNKKKKTTNHAHIYIIVDGLYSAASTAHAFLFMRWKVEYGRRLYTWSQTNANRFSREEQSEKNSDKLQQN